MKYIFSLPSFLLGITICVSPFFSACQQKKQADLIIHNAIAYTVDSAFTCIEAFAVKDGKFIATGSNSQILNTYEAKQMIDANHQVILPGLIDAHCHFYGYGKGLTEVNLFGTKSFDEVLQRLIEFNNQHPENNGWLIGRGWDQNDWPEKKFPNNKKLDSLFANRPVFLQRIDGHAAIVNTKAAKRTELDIDKNITGGKIEKQNNEFTGILIDNAVGLVENKIPQPTLADIKKYLLQAQKNCFAVGLTTVDDAGLDKNIIDIIDDLQKKDELKMRVYAMLSDNTENLKHYLKTGIYKTPSLNVRSVKCYADGALGSRGALLCSPYSDSKTEYGLLLQSANHFDSVAQLCINKGFQMNTHCIGDSAVKLIAEIYNRHLEPNSLADKRWRIEHLQNISNQILDLLAQKKLIPSVQPTHATSDMYWAEERLGKDRIKYAYAYKQQLQATGILALGTDFPVEYINPFYTFYAAVARKDLKGFPASGFQKENALSRIETLKGMTIWAAYSNFEETEKGSIEVGKWADFILINQDILNCPETKIHQTKVLSTYLAGQKVYDSKSE
jgi:predicted amidohydrolase YtcJ